MLKDKNLPTDETVLTPQQAAEYLNVPAQRLDYWRWNGRGPTYFRIGKSPRYTKAALNAYIGAQAVIPRAPTREESLYSCRLNSGKR
jgi:hypothetical protein